MMSLERSGVIIVAVVQAVISSAQPKWSVKLPPVQKEGYHVIVLSPEVLGRSHDGLVDLRLIDAAGKEVPYFIEQEQAVYDSAWMRPFDLLRNERVGHRTVVEMSIGQSPAIDALHVRVRNARVNKSARITGSDDRQTWYMVQDQSLSVGEGMGSTSVLRFLDLPLSSYRYYRLELNDSLSAPVQVLELGHEARQRREGRYTLIDELSFTRIEKGNQTHIGLATSSPFMADRVELSIDNEGPFLREGDFYTNTERVRTSEHRDVSTRRVSFRRDEVRERHVVFHGRFRLASYARGSLDAPGIVADTLWLSIENGNDRPLGITGARAYQLERRMIARLAAGQRYMLTTSDVRASHPHYDIEHFRDSLPSPVDTLMVPPMVAAPSPAVAEPSFAPGMKWVWAAIIGLGAIIAISAVRLLRKSSTTS